MKIFLAWHSKNKKAPNRIADQVSNHYQSFFKQELNKYAYSKNRTGLIYISDSTLAENTYFLQTDGTKVCFLTGTPTGLTRLFSEFNIESDSSNFLLRGKELFENNGYDLIKHISPPFIFGFIEDDSLQIVSDGLGAEQAFVYEDHNYWICSNRCWPIIKFLEKEIEINDIAWKHYFQIGYFPLRLTPFKGISVLDKGRVWSCNKGNVQEKKIDCFKHWLKPLRFPKKEILEFARISFNESIKELADRYTNSNVIADLSGGRDTRMILSSILYQDIECIFKTIGQNSSADTKVSKMLQKEYGLNMKYETFNLEELNKQFLSAKIKKFIQWQDGFGEMKNCKYISDEPQGEESQPILSGLIGGFYRGYGYSKHGLHHRLFFKLPKVFLKKIFIKKRQTALLEDKLEDIMKPAFQEGKKYGLRGNSLIDYFNFTHQEGTAATPYGGYLMPFLNIGLIRAYFSLDEEDRKGGIIHKFVINHNSEGLDKLPYDTDVFTNEQGLSRLPYDENTFWRSENGITIMTKIINENHYMWDRLINKETIFSMWRDHSEQKMKYGELFWRIAAFYFWYSEYN